METTWQPHEKHGRLTEQSDLPDSVFAFPKRRKEPLTDASHVRNSIARFDQVIGVSDEDRELAFANIKKAAKYYGVDMIEADWTQLGRTPHTGRTAADGRRSARKAAAKSSELGEWPAAFSVEIAALPVAPVLSNPALGRAGATPRDGKCPRSS
jgi:hypothetical protein